MQMANGFAQAISIHAPRTGSDNSITDKETLLEFQSTLPARGATILPFEVIFFETISIHAPRTGSDVDNGLFNEDDIAISIHAPRTGSDYIFYISILVLYNFNPRSPHGERRTGQGNIRLLYMISIHAPRTGSDADTARYG